MATPIPTKPKGNAMTGKLRKLLGFTMLAGLLVTITPSAATAGTSEIFCGTTSGKWSSSTAGRSGTVTITGVCQTPATTRLDMYVNGEWWVYTTGSVKVGNHSIKVSAPWMPKPNDRRGNYVWVKVTYGYAGQKNIYEQEIGWIPCPTCTG